MKYSPQRRLRKPHSLSSQYVIAFSSLWLTAFSSFGGCRPEKWVISDFKGPSPRLAPVFQQGMFQVSTALLEVTRTSKPTAAQSTNKLVGKPGRPNKSIARNSRGTESGTRSKALPYVGPASVRPAVCQRRMCRSSSFKTTHNPYSLPPCLSTGQPSIYHPSSMDR